MKTKLMNHAPSGQPFGAHAYEQPTLKIGNHTYLESRLSELWHISRTACAQTGLQRHPRLLWASAEYAKEHPDASSTGAYKALERMRL